MAERAGAPAPRGPRGALHRLAPASVRGRLTLAATAVLGVALVLAAVAVLVLVRASLVGALDDAAGIRAEEVAALAGARGLPEQLPVTGAVVQVLDADQRVLASSSLGDRLAPLVGPEEVADARAGRPVLLDGARLAASEPFRVVGRPVGAGAGPATGGTVLVATSVADVERAVGVLRGVALLGVPALLAVVALLAWRVTGSALAPVESLRRGAEALVAAPGPGGATRTLPVPGSRDEVARLATTLNDVLTRLHAAGERQRLFVGDAAHELRSPLGSLRTQLEVALAHPRAQRWPEVAADCLTDVERMSVLVEDLLVLARLDERAGGREVVDLGALAAEVAGERSWRVPVGVAAEPGVLAEVDRRAVRRAVANLVANAARHAGTAVRVGVRADTGVDGGLRGAEAVLEVADDGPGIAPGDRERVFERFTRLDDARDRDAGGTGLGLSIVRAAVERDGGTVRAEPPPGGSGALLRVRLPLARAAAPAPARPRAAPAADGGAHAGRAAHGAAADAP